MVETTDDFKPASIDTHKASSLDIVNKDVTLTVPLATTAGAQEAIFKGTKTPVPKECLLIIDNETGQVVLEKISEHIRVKKTRYDHSL